MGKQARSRKAEAVVGRNGDHPRTCGRSRNLVHHERGHGDQNFVLRFQEGFAEQVDGLVHPVGEQHFAGLDAEEFSNSGFGRLSLGVAGYLLWGQFAQSRQHARRTTGCVLVKVEPQPLTSVRGWIIGRQIAHSVASFKHGCT